MAARAGGDTVTGGRDFIVHLRSGRDPLAPARTPEYRLRRLLKISLRWFGLRAVSVAETASATPDGSADLQNAAESSGVAADVHRFEQPDAGVHR